VTTARVNLNIALLWYSGTRDATAALSACAHPASSMGGIADSDDTNGAPLVAGCHVLVLAELVMVTLPESGR
jgi:hypothetical protein